MRELFLAFISFSFIQGLSAQAVTPLGQSPPYLKWKQINSAHFQIIYPCEIEQDAQRITNALENAYLPVAASLHSLPRKIPIVMQNQTTDNNAFVSSEGRRAEFFSTPPQNPNNMGMNKWYDELSLHEYRHVVQMDQSRVGWGKYMYYLFGNSGTSVMQGLTNPWWFWEGDAVGCETTLGYGGRGRIPSFDLTFRTQLLTRGAFPYIKSACGSVKNAIPNHYMLGYFMTTYAKNHYGADVWSKILTHTYTKAPLPFSFSQGIKKTIGINVNQLYDSMTAELKSAWQKQLDKVQETGADYFHQPREKHFVNYKFPQYLPDGNIVAEKAGLDAGSFLAHKSSIVDQFQFVLLTKDGREKKLRISGVLDDNGVLSAAGHKIAWSEYAYDARWGARNYTVIKVLDVDTRKIIQLTKRSRYHAPAFSPDGSMIATMEYTTDNKFHLVLLDAHTGSVIKKFDNPGNIEYLEAHFTHDGKNILLVKAVAGAKSIVKVNIGNGQIKTVLQPIPENISAPVDYRNFVLYNSPQSGIDNIYGVDTLSGNVFRITNRKFGAFNPNIAPGDSVMSFQDFTVDGFRIATMKLDPGSWKQAGEYDTANKVEYFKPLEAQEAGNILAHVPDSVYPSSPYKRFKNYFRVFGWGIDPLTNEPNVSLGIRSVDMLSTATVEAGFEYNSNEKHINKYVRLSLQQFFPEFFFHFLDGRRNTIFPENQGQTTLDHFSYDLIHFQNSNLGVLIPLNLSKGSAISKLNLTSQFGYTNFKSLTRQGDGSGYSKNHIGHLYFLQQDLEYSILRRQAIRDVGPRLGLNIQFTYRNTPVKSNFQAAQTAANTELFLPGFFKHHSIRLRSYWQQDDSSNYHFENRFAYVRNKRNQLFHQWDLWSVDYRLPLFCPDAKILGGLFYFQRIKASLFAERATGKLSYFGLAGQKRDYTNLGIELSADVNPLRFLLPFTIGISSSYLTQDHSMNYGLIFKVPNIF